MLYGLLVSFLVFVCILLIIVILVQQGKGGIGLGGLGGGAQMLFGGSGGQDIFQKITWTLGAIFMLGTLGLFLLGSKKDDYSSLFSKKGVVKTAQEQAAQNVPAPVELPKNEQPQEAPASSQQAETR